MSIKVARELVELVRSYPPEEFENNYAAVLLEPQLRKILEQAPTADFRCNLIDDNTINIVCASAHLEATKHATNGITIKRTPYKEPG